MYLFQYFLLIIILSVVSSGCTENNATFPGYIEGEYTYISSGVAGTLFKLYVKRGQIVKKDEVLYSLDPQPEQSKVAANKNTILDLSSQVDFSKIQLERKKILYNKNTGSKADYDQAQMEYSSKSQQLAARQAELVATEWALEQKSQKALRQGIVFDIFYRIGEKVPENHPVLAILAPENIKVLFYIPEKRLSQIALGQKIMFTCDSCQEKFAAVVSYISPEAEYTPPVIYSKDTRDKLVYLIRADIAENQAKKFHPGQPISIYLSS